MSEIDGFRAVIDLWKTREALGAEMGEDSRLISKWWQRKSIPADRWEQLLALPKALEAGVTADMLAAFAARREPAEVSAA